MKRNWTVCVPGYRPFSMVLMDEALDHAGALRQARLTWPNCEIIQ